MSDAVPSASVRRVVLVHHGEAVAPEIDPQRPLTPRGRMMIEQLAQRAAASGIRPEVVWHSGKLRARHTAEALWRACNPFAEFRAIGGLRPEDGPWQLRDHLLGEERPVMVVGHMPNLPRVLGLLTTGDDNARPEFPLHGLVMLERLVSATLWNESGRLLAEQE
jgi:phosphohistidine phosphatase